MDLPTDAELRQMFDAVPQLKRYSVGDKVVRAGGAVVVKRARQLAPRSSRTGSTQKWGKSMFVDGGTGGTARSRSEKPLWKTIKQVVRKYSANAASIIGPEWPDGNKVYFFSSPKGRREVLWGTRTGRTIIVRNWIVQAFDETRSEQLRVMKTKLQQLMREIWE